MGIEGVGRITSTASEGMGSIRLELALGADVDEVLEDVKNGDLAFDRTLKADSAIDVSKMEVLDRL